MHRIVAGWHRSQAKVPWGKTLLNDPDPNSEEYKNAPPPEPRGPRGDTQIVLDLCRKFAEDHWGVRK